MPDILEDVNAIETLLLLGGIGILAYYGYKFVTGFNCKVLGIDCPGQPPTSLSYPKAVSQVVSDPFGSLKSIFTPTGPPSTIQSGPTPNTVVPGTGQTIAQLQNLGYSSDQINQLFDTAGQPLSDQSGYAAPGYGG